MSLGVSHSDGSGKYLGLPMLIGRKKSAAFQFIKDRVWAKIKGLNKVLLSRAGKEILIKSVLQAIPTYAMSLFLFPDSLCSDLERLISMYSWGDGKETKKIYWLSWSKMCASKAVGGLGFRKLQLFNLALVAKQGWKILTQPNSLVSRFYKARYFSRTHFLGATNVPNQSTIWQGLVRAIPLLKFGCRRRIGSGIKTSLSDPWLWSIDKATPDLVDEELGDLPIATIMKAEGSWDFDLIRCMFSSSDASSILNIPLSSRNSIDKWFWLLEKKGEFSVRSAYKHLADNSVAPNDTSFPWKKIWNSCVPPKVKQLVWRAISGILPDRSNLARRKVTLINFCLVCNFDEENPSHLFLHCLRAKECWAFIPGASSISVQTEFKEWMRDLLSSKKLEIDSCLVLIWSLWTNRNNIVWKNSHGNASQIFRAATDLLQQWKLAQASLENSHVKEVVVRQQKWKKPPANTLKCNVDAAILLSERKIGCGIVIRDSAGAALFMKASTVNGFHEADIAEAILSQGGFILAPKCDFAYFDMIINECCSLILEVEGVSYGWISRSANRVAHLLARTSSSLTEPLLGVNCIPSYIRDVLNSEIVE